jgi:hypothetical protein
MNENDIKYLLAQSRDNDFQRRAFSPEFEDDQDETFDLEDLENKVKIIGRKFDAVVNRARAINYRY